MSADIDSNRRYNVYIHHPKRYTVSVGIKMRHESRIGIQFGRNERYQDKSDLFSRHNKFDGGYYGPSVDSIPIYWFEF